MFGRKRKDESPAPVDPAVTAAELPAAQAPKGRPTPSRKQAEAARREQRKIPADPKAAKKARRERERLERAEARAGLMAGDERYMPPRDQGPAKAFTRDFVDRRRRISEYFVFFAVGILIAAFFPNPQVQATVSSIWFAATLIVVVEIVWMLVSLRRELARQWPEKAARKGCMPYGAMRCLQIRKLRVPPPRVRPGGAPIV